MSIETKIVCDVHYVTVEPYCGHFRVRINAAQHECQAVLSREMLSQLRTGINTVLNDPHPNDLAVAVKERDEARQERDSCLGERDAVRETLDQVTESSTRLLAQCRQERVTLAESCDRLRQERDGARGAKAEQLSRLADIQCILNEESDD